MRKGKDGFWLEVRLRLEPPLVGWLDTGGRALGRRSHTKGSTRALTHKSNVSGLLVITLSLSTLRLLYVDRVMYENLP